MCREMLTSPPRLAASMASSRNPGAFEAGSGGEDGVCTCDPCWAGAQWLTWSSGDSITTLRPCLGKCYQAAMEHTAAGCDKGNHVAAMQLFSRCPKRDWRLCAVAQLCQSRKATGGIPSGTGPSSGHDVLSSYSAPDASSCSHRFFRWCLSQQQDDCSTNACMFCK